LQNISDKTGYLLNIYNQGGYHKANYDKLVEIENDTDYLSYISTYANNISQYTYNSSVFLSQLVGYAATSNARGYLTGGISTGPLSGYPVTLHGREAVIPLGDGNSVVAYLREPEPPPNYIRQEAGDTQALRQALAELQQEIAALRRDGQTIGASTIGELKEHNRRERRREVNGTLVEVMS
jgi:hypothetical protein